MARSASALISSLFALLLLVCNRDASAQLSSLAFDPNCYQPLIGEPGVIDTIMGTRKRQRLGDGLINIGPAPNDPGGPGRLMFGGLAGDLSGGGPFIHGASYSSILCGPNFDMHHLNVSSFMGLWANSIFILGHFRNNRITDILLVDSNGSGVYLPKFYWADLEGNFDTSRYTYVDFQRPVHPKFQSAVQFPKESYHAYLTSDTAEDIIFFYSPYRGSNLDTIFVALITGGAHLFQPGRTVLTSEESYFDSTHVYDTNYGGKPVLGYSADFRGTGRRDYLAHDSYGNLFFYKNDPPFRLSEFADQIKDTLMASTTDPRLNSQRNHDWGEGGVAMKAFPRAAGDNSVDLLLPLDSFPHSHTSRQIRFFRGGPDFGSHRITLDSSAFTLHDIHKFDSNTWASVGWGGDLVNCGDMAGTGNNVLHVYGSGFVSGNHFFYSLGTALDEKVDMFISGSIVNGLIDTCTVDGDRFQDIAMGDAGYNMDNNIGGDDDKGTVRFIHGTSKIPSSPSSVVHRSPVQDSLSITAVGSRTLLISLSGDRAADPVDVELFNILGETVYRKTINLFDPQVRVTIPTLPNGAYQVVLRCCAHSARARVVIVQ